jgi:hypothetical protein
VTGGYVAVFGGVILEVANAIEVKVNRLLDHHGIRVSRSEIEASSKGWPSLTLAVTIVAAFVALVIAALLKG